ncbi:hypothetical protein SKAU_G00085470 [Synaphobranchus kaupii]|uniref:Uncharacterized protein n=1 Tax=Synaphobranchus kaupii TaxID=118154 RepID=A0A9Q1FW62_SYNKA|nr:hypothetical protein SKAU_G00085470 [Synaphobranchus kaupii]
MAVPPIGASRSAFLVSLSGELLGPDADGHTASAAATLRGRRLALDGRRLRLPPSRQRIPRANGRADGGGAQFNYLVRLVCANCINAVPGPAAALNGKSDSGVLDGTRQGQGHITLITPGQRALPRRAPPEPRPAHARPSPSMTQASHTPSPATFPTAYYKCSATDCATTPHLTPPPDPRPPPKP